MTTTVIGDNPGGGTVGGVQDVEIAQQYPTSPQGAATTSYLKADVAGRISRQLFKFDLTPITGTVIVSSAVLSILNADAVGSTRVVEIRKLLTSFVENEATWNKRNTSTNWNVAGGISGTDVAATVLGTGTMPTTGGRFTVSGAGFTQLVQDWINGVETNNGIILSVIDDTTVFDSAARRIANKNQGTAGNRPYLTIVYDVSTPPDVSVGDITVNNLSGTYTFTVSLSGSYALPVTVDYTTADDTATESVDYTAISGTLTFAPGESVKTVTGPILP